MEVVARSGSDARWLNRGYGDAMLCFVAVLNRVLSVRGQYWINGDVWLGQRWKARKVSPTPAANAPLIGHIPTTRKKD